MEYIFHETQDGLLCAQHCLNSLLQGDYYSAPDLANIAMELDKLERGLGGAPNHANMAGNHQNDDDMSSNYDDTGYFSIQVIQNALKQWNLDLVPFKSQSELATHAREFPTQQHAYICNFKQHWYTIRKLGKYWFNLNSVFKRPELISDTYLAVLLKQLETDGYSIFIVDGQLPKSEADTQLQETDLNIKEILNKQVKGRGTSTQLNNNGFDDDELKRALKMSLIENDIDLDQSNKHFQHIDFDQMRHSDNNDADDELKKAIEMSLQSSCSNETVTATSASSSDLSADEIRKKRLKYLEKLDADKKTTTSGDTTTTTTTNPTTSNN